MLAETNLKDMTLKNPDYVKGIVDSWWVMVPENERDGSMIAVSDTVYTPRGIYEAMLKPLDPDLTDEKRAELIESMPDAVRGHLKETLKLYKDSLVTL